MDVLRRIQNAFDPEAYTCNAIVAAQLMYS